MRINDIEYIEVEVLDVRAAAQASEAFSMIVTERYHPDHYIPDKGWFPSAPENKYCSPGRKGRSYQK